MTKRAICHIRKEQFVRKVRYIGELTIFFRDKDSILISDSQNLLLCERWYEGRGFYSKNWRPFVEKLTQNNSLNTIADALRFVIKYDITTHVPKHDTFEITEDVLVLPTHFKAKRRPK